MAPLKAGAGGTWVRSRPDADAATGLLGLVVASLLWGSLYPAAKPALAATGPMQVTFCRVVLAFVSLGSLILLRSGPGLLVEQLRAHWRAVLVLGIFNFAVSVAIAALFLHEPISPALALGTLCILIGLVATQIASTARRATVTASAR